uniref:Mucin-17-like isoform X1 n=2 Tax=Nicotiana sylvestris TaxID=4096 RepID=A0A1U7VGG0_NICSY|nr:PREDICTED: mucin-17-like isoform X1 [Nicotiana sylvestris]
MTSLLASSFPTTSHPAPSCQATSLPSPSFQATRQQTASFQATTQPTPSCQVTSLPTPCIQPTPSFKGTSLPTPSFQATRQKTTSFHATTLPTPSSQATGLITPLFQAMGQTTPSFQSPVNPAPAQVTSNKHAKRESSHHWTVDGIDSHGDTKRLKLKTREASSLPQEKHVVEFDCLDPISEAQDLVAGVCGLLAIDCTIFPISFDKWSDMPKSYFNDCFNNIIKAHFCFMTIEEVARGYVYCSIAKKWAASRQKLWDEFKDPLKTKDEIMDNVPLGITRDQWTSFVNYHYKEETQMGETGRKPGRAQLYLATHTKRDGSYVNKEAKEICEKIELAVSESIVDESEISPKRILGR